MRRPLALGVVALAAVGGADGATTPSYLPVAAGNTWYLADVQTGGDSKVVMLPRKGGGVILRGFPGLADTRIRSAGAAVEAWDKAARRWEPFLRLGAPAGTRYTVDLADSGLWRRVSVTVASRSLAVRDANGRRLEDCVRLTFTYGKGLADAGLEELVFAPRLGLARVAEQTIAGTRVRVLVQFTAGATK